MTAHPKPKPRKREAVKIFPDGREVCANTIAGKRAYKDRAYLMLKRQGFRDAITGSSLHPSEVTFDHQSGRGSGGGHRDDRIELPDGTWQNAALSIWGNTLKGSKRYHWCDGKYVPTEK